MRLLLLASLALGATPLAASTTSPAADSAPWDLLSRLQTNEALAAFADAEGEEARYGEAVTLLNVQPKTQANIQRAAHLLETLAARAESPQAPAARYHLARIAQLHATPPRPDEALARYRELAAAYPGHPYADAASAKIALLTLYRDLPPADWDAAFRGTVGLLPAVASAEARRDIHLILGFAALRMRADHELALPHLVVALESGLSLRVSRHKIVLLQAAESARILGDLPRAIAFYEAYLSGYPYDFRGHEIRQIVQTLRAGPDSAAREAATAP